FVSMSTCAVPHCTSSSPTRRSSDLFGHCERVATSSENATWIGQTPSGIDGPWSASGNEIGSGWGFESETSTHGESGNANESAIRSEEHTSELQSRFDLVCRLLLDKK